MSEELFAEEVKFPEDLDSMLSMSIQYEKLQGIMKFMLDLLKRHEQGLRISFSKHNVSTPEIMSLHSFKENVEVRVSQMEKTINKASIKLEEVKTNLDNRGDTVETLKFLLNMITSHDTDIIVSKRQIIEILQEKRSTELRLQMLETSLKEIQTKSASEKTSEYSEKIMDEKKYRPSMEKTQSISDMSSEDNLKIYESTSRPVSTTKETSQDTLSYKVPSRRYYKKPRKSSDNLLLPVNEAEIPEDSLQSGKITSMKSQIKEVLIVPEIINTSLPLFEPNPLEEKLKSPSKFTFQLTSPQIPEHLKELMTRVQIIEKILETAAETSEVKTRLGKLESMQKIIEGVLDSCEPLTLKNREEIMKIVRGLKTLESEMVNKLNTEEFDAIKSLVIALASGSPKHNPSTIIPTREINMIRMLEKKLAEIEIAISDVVKVYPENIEEVIIKLKRIERKMDIKADGAEVEELKKIVNELMETNKTLTSALQSREKTPITQNQRITDSTVFASINRRLSSFEEILRNLKIPYGIDLTHIWEEIKKIWEASRTVTSALEEFKKLEGARISEIRQTIEGKADMDALKVLEMKTKKAAHEFSEQVNSQFAEKIELRRGLKYLEALIKTQDYVKTKPEGDDAMLARKPLGGWSCASCEKKLDTLTGKVANHSPWGKMPYRDPSERILKAGPGYSKMLTTLQIDTLRSSEDITLPSIRHTDRSITPQP